MKESYFIGASEVQEIVGCSKSRAYQFIQQMNKELEAKGLLTFPGRVPRRYAFERFGITEVQDDAKGNNPAGGNSGGATTGNRKHRRGVRFPTERDPAPYEPITYHVPLDADLQQYTAEMCDLYEVPLELAYAVMQVESGYTVSATSSTGDYGLMQINSINAGWLKDELGVTDLLDACQNIKAGCYMLGSYLALYDGDINRTMMAYNLGKSGAEKAWNAGTRSTAYTDKVWNAMVGLLEEERDVS